MFSNWPPQLTTLDKSPFFVLSLLFHFLNLRFMQPFTCSLFVLYIQNANENFVLAIYNLSFDEWISMELS